MANYICYLKSDLYKLYHSCFFLLHVIFAVCGAAMMLLYAGVSQSDDINKLAAYFQIMLQQNRKEKQGIFKIY